MCAFAVFEVWGLEVRLGNGTDVAYDGGVDDGAAASFCAQYRVEPVGACVEHLVAASRATPRAA